MSGRQIRNWANRNLFLGSISSFDSAATENDPAAPNEGQSSQTYGSVAKRLEVVGEEHFGAEESEDAEGVHQKKRITALQAAWNVTNAIQGISDKLNLIIFEMFCFDEGMFIVGLPFSVKVINLMMNKFVFQIFVFNLGGRLDSYISIGNGCLCLLSNRFAPKMFSKS